MKHRYKYSGPVLAFDRLICDKWRGETVAETPEKAKSNLAYQFKKKNNLEKNARIYLPNNVEKGVAIL